MGYLLLALVISGKIPYKDATSAAKFFYDLGQKKGNRAKSKLASRFMTKIRGKEEYRDLRELYMTEDT